MRAAAHRTATARYSPKYSALRAIARRSASVTLLRALLFLAEVQSSLSTGDRPIAPTGAVDRPKPIETGCALLLVLHARLRPHPQGVHQCRQQSAAADPARAMGPERNRLSPMPFSAIATAIYSDGIHSGGAL